MTWFDEKLFANLKAERKGRIQKRIESEITACDHLQMSICVYSIEVCGAVSFQLFRVNDDRNPKLPSI